MKFRAALSFLLLAHLVPAQEEKKVGQIDSLKNELISADDSARIGLLYSIAGLYKFANTDSGMLYLKKLLNETKRQQNRKEEGKCYMLYASYYTSAGNWEATNEYYLKALRVREEIRDTAGIGNVYIGMGRIYMAQRNYVKAKEVLTKALELLQRHPSEPNSLALANMDLASAYFHLGDTAKCFELNYEAVRIRKKIPNYGWYVFITELGIARLFIETRQYDSLKVYLDRFTNSTDTSWSPPEAFMLPLWCKYYSGTGRHEQAITCAKRMLDNAEKARSQPAIMEACQYLAGAYEAAGMWSEAIPYFSRYDKLKDSLSDSESMKKIAMAQAQFEVEKKDKQILLLNADNNKKQLVLYAYTGGALLVSVLLVFVARNLSQNRKANKALSETKRIIAQKNQEITDSINYAQRIQEAILPARGIKYRHFPDAFVLFRPRDVVSGDFYWFSARGSKRLIAAADCTGHGVPGAFMSMLGNTFLGEIVNENGTTSPDEVLDQLRSKIVSALKQEQNTDSKDGMDIALCVFDDANNTLEFSGAYNPLYHIRNGELREIRGDKQPVGLSFGEPKPFTRHTIPLQQGDCFYIFSDGYAHQFGGKDRKKFKYSRLKGLLLEVHRKPMSEQEEILHQAFIDWKGPFEQIDDVLVIGVRV
ncbi:MAG: SpoIIE family protein phosphatase [Bacteroidota bacterium]